MAIKSFHLLIKVVYFYCFKYKKMNKNDLKNFGLIWTTIFLVVSFYYFFAKESTNFYSIFLFFLFLIISFLRANLLSNFYNLWIKFWNIMGWINTKIIMFILFFFLFTPIWLILKLFWKDLLNKKIDKKTKTYWIKRTEKINSMKYQF